MGRPPPRRKHPGGHDGPPPAQQRPGAARWAARWDRADRDVDRDIWLRNRTIATPGWPDQDGRAVRLSSRVVTTRYGALDAIAGGAHDRRIAAPRLS